MNEEQNVDTPTVDTGTAPEMEGAEVDVWDMDDEQFEQMDITETQEETVDTVDYESLHRQQLETDENLPQPIVLKVDGEYIEVGTVRQLKDLAEKGAKFTKNSQDLKPYRTAVELMEAGGIEVDDLNLLIEAKHGNLRALRELQSRYNAVDEREIEDHTSELAEQRMEKVAEEIVEKGLDKPFQEIIADLPQQDVELFRSSPDLTQKLAVDIESGFAQKVHPMAMQMAKEMNISYLTAYRLAGEKVMIQQQDMDSKASRLKAQPRNTGTLPKATKDIWEMDDQEFEKLMNSGTVPR